MRRILLLFLLAMPWLLPAQTNSAEQEVVAVIRQLFNGMRAADSAQVHAVFHPEMRLMTTQTDKAGNPQLSMADINRFLASIGTSRPAMLDERIWSYQVRIDQRLATVWTPYSFYVGDKFSHCGVNAFQLFNGTRGWQIIQITDTRSTTNCREGQPQEGQELRETLNAFIDDWHRASATADEEAYFNAMTEDAVFIGTDMTERWLRDELRAWAKSAFEKDVAWAFTVKERHITLAVDGSAAWWDELLDTAMGPCRATGVLEFTPAGWKIKHYQLSVTVPNDKINKLKKLQK